MDNESVNVIRQKHIALKPFLNERSRRLWAATEAKAIGRGGKTLVSCATNLSQTTIYYGMRELDASPEKLAISRSRTRTEGGGRRHLIDQMPEIKDKSRIWE